MKKNRLHRYEFEILNPADIGGILEELERIEQKYLLGYIYAYMHNTVIVQSLKKELEKRLPSMKLSLRKHEHKRGAKLIVYGFDCPPFGEDLEGEVISSLEEERTHLSKDLKICKQDLIKKFFNDHLTNIPNIFKLRKDLQDCQDVTLIDITIDEFKSINSFYGFLVGDYVLENLAQYLLDVPDADVYKMPGGEFILLLHRHYSYYDLKEYLDEFYEKVSQLSVTYSEVQISLDFTIAAATAHSIDNILAKLSMALMFAQKNKLPYFIYEDRLEFESNYRENLAMTTKVREAIKNDRIVAYYQPIVDNTTGQVAKYETLARLVNDEGEILAPDQFLQISKKTKIYSAITKKMIKSAFEMFADNDYEFSINISVDDIINQDTYYFIIEKLRNSDLSDRIIFEFVESDAISGAERTLEFVKEVKRYGAKIAIDDFGSGYSNFSMLVNMKVDYIKIDGSLISNIDRSWSSLLVVESIVDFAKKLNVRVIAEYVYSSTIYSKVKELGIEFSQGFYIDKPRIDIKETSI